MESFETELRTVRERVGLFEDPDAGLLEISGSASPSYLHRMTSNDVEGQPVKEARIHALLDRKGMVLALFSLLRAAEARFLALGPRGAISKGLEILERFKFREAVELRDLSDSWRSLSVIGPGADPLFNKTVVPAGLYTWREGFLKVPLWRLIGPSEEIQRFLEGTAIKDLIKIEKRTLKLLKMEVGLPEFGVDIDEHHILLEADLPYAYKRQKGCYPGQEVVERISAYGKGRAGHRICTLVLSGEVPVSPQSEVLTTEGQSAGRTTSSLYDPVERRTLVMATLESRCLESSLTIQHRPARVAPSSSSSASL